jgi:hypothetical protein
MDKENNLRLNVFQRNNKIHNNTIQHYEWLQEQLKEGQLYVETQDAIRILKDWRRKCIPNAKISEVIEFLIINYCKANRNSDSYDIVRSIV